MQVINIVIRTPDNYLKKGLIEIIKLLYATSGKYIHFIENGKHFRRGKTLILSTRQGRLLCPTRTYNNSNCKPSCYGIVDLDAITCPVQLYHDINRKLLFFSDKKCPHQLNEKERYILTSIRHGVSVSTIAADLGCDRKTVYHYKYSAMAKLNIAFSFELLKILEATTL